MLFDRIVCFEDESFGTRVALEQLDTLYQPVMSVAARVKLTVCLHFR
jgi:hypothetical protein